MPHPLQPSRQERRKQQTRRRLLDAARQVIGHHGYEATNVLDITEAADVSKGTFYQHFKDKEALTHTLIMEGFEELNRRINLEFDNPPGPERIQAALRAVFQYASDNRDLFRIMLGPEASAELNMFAFTYYAGVVEDILGRVGIAERSLPYPPALLAQFIAGAGVRMGLWWMEDDHGLSPADMGDIMHHLLTQGIPGLLNQGPTPPAAS
jgi:AcrR family transcriptional regulator